LRTTIEFPRAFHASCRESTLLGKFVTFASADKVTKSAKITLPKFRSLMSQSTLPPHECAVLFADLVGSTQLYQRVGDKSAFEVVDKSIRAMRIAVETKGGRVVKHTGDGLMAVFRDADSAADATLAIHQTIKELPAPEQRLAVRIGFHFGAVVASGTDVFGDTVNFAARLAELASPGKAITSAETARRLGPEWRSVHTLRRGSSAA
jgi:class 3 adenylate cyclase